MKILDYGKSMYGGWYINFFDGKYKGIHGKTLSEVCDKLKINKSDVKKACRRDN
jgi:hypothetical protein